MALVGIAEADTDEDGLVTSLVDCADDDEEVLEVVARAAATSGERLTVVVTSYGEH